MARRAALSFALRPLAPGDPIDALLFGQPSSPQTVALHTRLGLDRPLHIQYLAYLGGVGGDLGTSFATQRLVGEKIGDRFRNTLLLAGASVSLGLLVGVGAGVLDAALVLLSTAGLALPSFWLAVLLADVLTVRYDAQRRKHHG